MILKLLRCMPRTSPDQLRPEQSKLPTTETGAFGEIFRTPADIRAYAGWRQAVAPEFRQVVEGVLMGRTPKHSGEMTPLVGQFLQGTETLLHEPETDVGALACDPRVKKQLQKLQHLSTEEAGKEVNIFSLLRSPDVSFDDKTAFYQSEIENRLGWLRGEDGVDMAEYQETASSIDVQASEESEEYTPHRAPQQESGEGEPQEAAALVYPFYGGYYLNQLFDTYNPTTLTWRQSRRDWDDGVPDVKLPPENSRVYRSAVSGGGRVCIEVPDGWGVDARTLMWVSDTPPDSHLIVDQDGRVNVSIAGESEKSYAFTISIGKSSHPQSFFRKENELHEIVPDRFPTELNDFAREVIGAKLPTIAKARKITSHIRSHLEYDQDMQWEAIYKADPAAYFEKIWEHKKAKCDEANTLAARLLTSLGFEVRFAGGHSVRTKSPKGEAMLTSQNGHAWMYVWDEAGKKWARLDATPKGDPNVDEEQQNEELGEGDYGGEGEAELMTEEELQKEMEKIEKESEKETAEPPEVTFAHEAGTTPEEAKHVLDLIARVRQDHRGVLQEASKYWQTVVRRHVVEMREYRGPVRQSEGDILEELVDARIDVRTGETDPTGWAKEARKRKEYGEFGGFEVYIAADQSSSMEDLVNGIKKSDAQRDMVFLLVDSIMSAAAKVQEKGMQITQALPVKVCVAVFGAETEVVLPTTDTWGPSEQIRLYRALDRCAGGSTPDDRALEMIEDQIKIAKSEEASVPKVKKGGKIKKHGHWTMHRFAVVVADGGSDSPHRVKAANLRLDQAGIPVDLFLIASESDSNLQQLVKASYQSVSVTPDPSQLAKKGVATLTKRLRQIYGD